jgi:hypothetical protein
MSMRFSWSSAEIFFSSYSDVLPRISARSLATSLQVLVELQNLELRLSHLPFGLSYLGGELATLATNSGRVSF